MEDVLYGPESGSIIPTLIGSEAWAIAPNLGDWSKSVKPPNANAPPVTVVSLKKLRREILCIGPVSSMVAATEARSHPPLF
jgi:hypothetical protein